MTWTPELDSRLRDLVDAGKTNREIGDALGIGANAIGGRKFKLGLTKPNGRRGQPKRKQKPE